MTTHRSHRLLFCIAGFLAACAAIGDTPNRIDQLVERSGLDAIFRSQAAAVARSAENVDKNPFLANASPERLEAVRLSNRAAATAYTAEAMHADAAAVFSQRLAPADQAAMLAWFDSPTGARMAEAEAQAALVVDDARNWTAAADRRRAEWEKAAPELQERCVRWSRATRAGEASAASNLRLASAAAEGAIAGKPGMAGLNVALLRAGTDMIRKQMIAGTIEAARKRCVTTFATLPAEDFDRAIAFFEAPAGKAYVDATVQAAEVAFEEAQKRAAAAMANAKAAAK